MEENGHESFVMDALQAEEPTVDFCGLHFPQRKQPNLESVA